MAETEKKIENWPIVVAEYEDLLAEPEEPGGGEIGVSVRAMRVFVAIAKAAEVFRGSFCRCKWCVDLRAALENVRPTRA